jgi:uncharacterized membrane protein YbhN (UPF0104 family)
MSVVSSRSPRADRARPLRSRSEHPAVTADRRAAHRDRPETRRPRKRPWVGRRLGTLVLVLVLAAALLASVPGLRGVAHQISRVSPWWIVLAVALEVASELSFVAMFRLFFDRGPTRELRRLAWSELAFGALIPGGGAGGLAIGGWLMHLAGAPTRWVVRRSEGLFFLSGAVSAAALIGAGLALIAGTPGPHGFVRAVLPTAIALAAMLAIAALPRILRPHPGAPSWLLAISAGVEEAERITFTRRPSWRLFAAAGYLAFDIAVLWVALRALGHPPSVPTLTMAYSIGYAANSLPIPGGIGVLDAGLTGALALYGASATHAAAAVLIYHAIALLVPGAGGLYAYLRLRPRLLERGACAPTPVNPHHRPRSRRRHTMNTLAVMLEPVEHGWAVTLTDGRELARFIGPGARRRALRYLAANGLWRQDEEA